MTKKRKPTYSIILDANYIKVNLNSFTALWKTSICQKMFHSRYTANKNRLYVNMAGFCLSYGPKQLKIVIRRRLGLVFWFSFLILVLKQNHAF
jgi:hypothetical protein